MTDRKVKVVLEVTGAEAAAAEFDRMGVAAGASGETIGRNLRMGIEQGLNRAEAAADQSGDRIGDAIGDGIRQGTDEGTADAAADAGEAGSEIGSGMADAIKGAITGAAIGATLVAAMDVEDGNAKLQAQLGITADEAGEAGALAGELWTGNYAEGMEEARDLARSTISALGDYSSDFAGDEIKKYAGYASNLATMTGEEADSIIQAVSRMMRTGLVDNVDEAFDVLTRASQKTTAGMQGDLIDVGAEYADVFAQVGLDGSQAFAALADASKDGAINMDKVGDSLKEFTILATNLDDTGEIYQQLGLDGQKMANDLLAGGETARTAMMTIVQALQSIEDPTTQATTAISFFGAPLEDLGTRNIPAFLASLSAASDGLGDFRGTAGDVDEVLGSTMSGRFSTLTKEAMGVGTAFGQTLLPALEALMPIFTVASEILGNIGTLLGSLPGWALPAAAAITAIGLAMKTAHGHAGGMRAGLLEMGKTVAKGGLLAAGVVVLSSIGEIISKNEAQQQMWNDTTEDLSAILIENGNQWDTVAQKKLEADIKSDEMFQRLLKSGANYADVMAGIEGNADAMGRAIFDATEGKLDTVFAEKVEDWAEGWRNVKGASQEAAAVELDFEGQQAAIAGAKEQSDRYVASLELMASGAYGAAGGADELADSTSAAGEAAATAADDFDLIAESTADYRDETGRATAETDLFMAALESLVSGQVSVDTATRAAAAANREMGAAAREVAQSLADKAAADQIVIDLVNEGKQGTAEYDQALRDQADAADAVADAADGQADSFIQAAAAERSMIAATFQANVESKGLGEALGIARAQAENARSAFINQAMASGMGAAEAARQADALGLIPTEIETELLQTGADAVVAKAGEARDAINGMPLSRQVELNAVDNASYKVDLLETKLMNLNGYTSTVYVNQINQGGAAGSGVGYAPGLAAGGAIHGPGSKGVDSVHVVLAPGEHVLTAAEVDRVGGQAAVYAMRQAIMSGGLPRFAEGGAVAAPPIPSASLISMTTTQVVGDVATVAVTFPGAGPGVEAILRQYARAEIVAREAVNSRRAVSR